MTDFEPRAKQYSVVNAERLGEAADLAYQDRAAVERTLKSWGMRGRFLDVVDLKKGDTQAFVAADPTVLVVAFRGSKDPLDFVTDARFAQTAFAPEGAVRGKVHSGFVDALDVAWPAVRAAIREFRDASQPIWVTGHSLGAGLATLAVAHLAVEGAEVSGLYTFGSPRVGDTAFAASFDAVAKARTFRFVNDLDIVPRVPPEGVPLLPPYQHIGTRKVFDANGALTDRPDKLRWLTVAATAAEIAARAATTPKDQLKADIRTHVKEPVDDHAMANYLKNLAAARTGSLQPEGTSVASVLTGLAGAVSAFRDLWRK